MTPVIIRAVESRRPCVEYLCERIPEAHVVWDTYGGNCFNTFTAALNYTNGEPAIHLEDDITLTVDWRIRAEHAIVGHRAEVVQMFSMRPTKDLTVGSRYNNKFMMTQCFYLPRNAGPSITATPAYHHRSQVDPGGIDLAIQDWLKATRTRCWLHVPSLVQHNESRSLLGHRSTKRQSPTFTRPDHANLTPDQIAAAELWNPNVDMAP
jgi:hypothetical protein